MRRAGMTIKEAAESWVHEMNAIEHGLLEKLISADPDEWHEITKPSYGDRVYMYETPEDCDEHWGTIENYLEKAGIYLVNLDDGTTVEVEEDDFEVDRDGILPMWGTLWSFGDSADDYWLEELDGIQIMSECGFRIYESEEFGYFFGIDGAGYDFYEAHWLPLYKKRGLQWHDPMTESGSFVMTEWRKAELYKAALAYIDSMVGGGEAFVESLREIGLSEKEIEFERSEVL